ncbi:C6 transcription factor, putative [Paecilomyces variotii No. 5]|uniref:C6 transcription factor, putative n=1 Tax=Byssochlamys spectabilis (strain No. 5 / NBRC 109023) TaxID=1356009 RepID=V5G0P3_BYSSN|nr:C6 transcription factor, putative [Paecilomyces variotii No. 5]
MYASQSSKRSKRACNSCRERKRKCDGEIPCMYCTKNGHECTYEQRQKRRRRAHARRLALETDANNTRLDEDPESPTSELQLIEDNSPAVFLKNLGLNIDPAASPVFNYYAWNLGFPQETAYLMQKPRLTEILTLDRMYDLTAIYFAEIAPVYDFLGREYVRSAIGKRWLTSDSCGPVDSLLCGIAALGCLFGKKARDKQAHLLQIARMELEKSLQEANPHIDHVFGWQLRAIYLRMTESQQATWMATCNLMHMIEATKLHFETRSDSITTQTSEYSLPEQRRRIYSVAQLFNTWVSLDCSRSHVELRGASTLMPETSWTKEQQELCRLTELLRPSVSRTFDELETELSRLCYLNPAHPMQRLIQCNIALCICRRVRALGRSLSDHSLSLILELSAKGLHSVRELSGIMSPWCHIVNVPFQMVCIFLAIDNRQSLLHLADALATLKTVAEKYDTEAVKESYAIARMLVNLQRQRKSKELSLLDNVLEGHGVNPTIFANVSMEGYYAFDQNSFFPGNTSGDFGLTNDSLLDYFVPSDPFHVPQA